MKRALMIAFHLPPVKGGVHRTLCFMRHLPGFRWGPMVLTVDPRFYYHNTPGPAGDTARVARAAGVTAFDAVSDTAAPLGAFPARPAQAALPGRLAVAGAPRRGRTRELAKIPGLAATVEV